MPCRVQYDFGIMTPSLPTMYLFNYRQRVVRWVLSTTALPLALAMWWTAVHFPISSLDYWFDVKWIDDRFVVIQHQYLPYRHGMLRPHQCVFREYLVDCERRVRTQLNGKTSEPDFFYSAKLPEISPGGSIVRTSHRYNRFWLQQIDPSTRKSRVRSVGKYSSALVGSRYLISQGQHEFSNQTFLEWRDLLDPEFAIRRRPFEAFTNHLVPIVGAPAFFAVPLVGNLPWYKDSNDIPNSTVVWIDELRRPDRLHPTPIPNFQGYVEMLVLYKMSDQGPEYVSRWPVVGCSGLVTVQTSSGLISSLRPDATAIDVRDAMTGKIVSSVPVPPSALPPDCRPNWRLHEKFLTLFDINRKPVQTLDAATNTIMPTQGALDGRVYDQVGKNYLTIRDADLSKPESWPLTFQVRELPTGNILTSYKYSGLNFSSPKFTLDGKQVKYIGDRERVIYVDALNGKIVRVIEDTVGRRALIGVCTSLFAIAWLVLFIGECRRAGVSDLVRSLLLTSVLLGFLVARLYFSGNHQNYNRVAWQVIGALKIAWGIAVALRLASPVTDLRYRTLQGFVFLLICWGLGTALVESGWEMYWAVYQFIVMGGLLLTWAVGLRLLGKLPPRECALRRRKTYSLRLLFIWITLAAIVAAWANRFNWRGLLDYLTPQTALVGALEVSARVFVALSVVWATRHIVQRPMLSVALVATVLVPAIFGQTHYRSLGFHPDYVADGFLYACWHFVSIVIIVAIGFSSGSNSHHPKKGLIWA